MVAVTRLTENLDDGIVFVHDNSRQEIHRCEEFTEQISRFERYAKLLNGVILR